MRMGIPLIQQWQQGRTLRMPVALRPMEQITDFQHMPISLLIFRIMATFQPSLNMNELNRYPPGYPEQDVVFPEFREQPAQVSPVTSGITRAYRNAALAESDWTQAADSPLSDETKAEWAQYRQVLRDLTEGDPVDPSGSDWPQPPSS